MTDQVRRQGRSRRGRGRPETRSRILAAAKELMPRAGASLPVTQIARQAGVAIQTIYDQFGSKGGLLIAVLNDVQASLGLFDSFRAVFRSRDGEEAMRRMIDATMLFWDQAWPYLEFLLKSRRIDPIVAREMDYIDRLRHAHFWAIAKRLDEEGRLRAGASADTAADQAFAFTTPNVYEELAVRRTASAASVAETATRAVLGAILEPGVHAAAPAPPNWAALELASADRAKAGGADPARLAPQWWGARSERAAGSGRSS